MSRYFTLARGSLILYKSNFVTQVVYISIQIQQTTRAEEKGERDHETFHTLLNHIRKKVFVMCKTRAGFIYIEYHHYIL